MTAGVPTHVRHMPRPSQRVADAPRQTSTGMLLALIIPGLLILWAALAGGLYWFTYSLAGMDTFSARAFAIGFVSYVFVSVGFVFGLVKLITHEGCGAHG